MALITGVVGTIISVIMFWPQAVRIWRGRHNPASLAGVSLLAQWGVLLNATVWLLYAWSTKALWAGAPGLVNIPVAILCLRVLHRQSTAVGATISTD